MTSSNRTTIFVLALMACASISLAQPTDDAQQKENLRPAWKEYSYPAYGFAITVPGQPEETGIKNGTKYLLYWDEDAEIVINLSTEREPDNCSAWLAWAESVFVHPGPKNAFVYPAANVGSTRPVAASSKLITVDGHLALEAEAPRNGLQSGYERYQCLDGTLYQFEAGWEKGQSKPPIVDRIVSSFRLFHASTLLGATNPSAQAAPGDVVKYHATINDVKYVYASVAPVARLKPGDILDTNTLDCFGNAIEKPGDTLGMSKGDNPLTGPFYVEGAEPGDTLAVKILDLEVDGDQGVGAFAPGFGALNETNYTPMLHPPLPEKIWFYPIDHATNTATFQALDSKFSVKIPLHPFFGCIGVAPAGGEARSSIVPAEFGGNMDSPEASLGNTIYFPVNVPGGLLYMGDGHAAMGDGEVAGTAIEVPLHARIQVNVIKGQKISWPRFENADAIMTVGAYRPLDDCVRIAFTELVSWIHQDYGLSEFDAYELLSQVAKIHLNEMVDPNYVVVASIEKKYLPPKKK